MTAEYLLDSALAADINNALGWANSLWDMRGQASPALEKTQLAVPGPPTERDSSAKYRVTVPNTISVNQNISDWPGDFGFSVRFDDEPKTGKNMTWALSVSRRKLYVGMNMLLPVHFSTERPPPPGSVVCVVAAYRDCNFRRENVERCPHHADLKHVSNKLTTGTHPYPEHWIRCDHPATRYCRDMQNGGRHCLYLPLEAPEPISNHPFTYCLAFMCHNSCTGGPSRKSTDVIFILQSPGGKDIARAVFEVKVCACPGRDRDHDEVKKGRTPSLAGQSLQKRLCVQQTSPRLPTKKRKRPQARQVPSPSSSSAELPIWKPLSVPQPIQQVIPTEPSSSVPPSDSDGDNGPPYILTFDSEWSKLAYELLSPIHEALEFVEASSRERGGTPSGDFPALRGQVE